MSSRRLHITNGDSAGNELRTLFPADAVLSWNDPLHDGPVPPSLPLRELSAVRAGFVAGVGWDAAEAALADFGRRDSVLENYADFCETVLWFEHDLYDQLQLIQLLDWFAGRGARLSLAQSSHYLGCLDRASLAALFEIRAPVTPSQFALAARAWQAFRSPDPRALEPLLEPQPDLPFLAAALLRHCEEYPWTTDGLSRTARTIATLRAQGISHPNELYRAFSATEDPVWMGDSSFFLRLEGRLVRETPWRWDPTRRRFALRP